ncbi:MAG: hypothetical protein DMF88_01970 [Acidobacteria bacterium]|nr:MAG: hypothetical protein DMF88_01970 [Acidobacteriota bacterium]
MVRALNRSLGRRHAGGRHGWAERQKYTRTDYNTLRRVVTIDDPGTFTKPFDITYEAKLGEPGSEIIEYFCIENNQWGERTNPNATAPAIPVAK